MRHEPIVRKLEHMGENISRTFGTRGIVSPQIIVNVPIKDRAFIVAESNGAIKMVLLSNKVRLVYNISSSVFSNDYLS